MGASVLDSNNVHSSNCRKFIELSLLLLVHFIKRPKCSRFLREFLRLHVCCCYCGCSGVTKVAVTDGVTLFSERELMFTFAICRRPSVCLSSVTFVHPTQPIEIFGNVFTPFGTLAICDPSVKILRRSFQGNPSVGELNQRGVEKCSDFRPFQGYISETVQDRR